MFPVNYTQFSSFVSIPALCYPLVRAMSYPSGTSWYSIEILSSTRQCFLKGKGRESDADESQTWTITRYSPMRVQAPGGVSTISPLLLSIVKFSFHRSKSLFKRFRKLSESFNVIASKVMSIFAISSDKTTRESRVPT